MRRKTKIIVFWIAVFIISVSLYIYNEKQSRYHFPESVDPEIGQTWGYLKGDPEDPFIEMDTVLFEVINIQGEYVLFSRVESDYTMSSTIRTFKLRSILIKDNDE